MLWEQNSDLEQMYFWSIVLPSLSRSCLRGRWLALTSRTCRVLIWTSQHACTSSKKCIISLWTSWRYFPCLNLGIEFNKVALQKGSWIYNPNGNELPQSIQLFSKYLLMKMKISVIPTFWKDKLQVLIISIDLNESSCFIDKHPKHGWHKLWWTQNNYKITNFPIELQGNFLSVIPCESRKFSLTLEVVWRVTWKSNKSLAKYRWDSIHNPYIAAGITSLGDERANPLPLIDFSIASVRSSLLIPILRWRIMLN